MSVDIYRYERSLATLWNSQNPIFFLAGPTVRGNQLHLESWRPGAIELFERKITGNASIIIPEFSNRTESDKGKNWIPAWEFAGLCVSDVIVFWVPRTKELIGLTTNHEIGFWLGKHPDKIIYGRPNDSYRNGYLDTMMQISSIQFNHKYQEPAITLDETINRAIELVTPNNCRAANRIKSKVYVDSPYGAFQP